MTQAANERAVKVESRLIADRT